MGRGLHILSLRQKLQSEKAFLKSLLCQKVSKRKFLLEKASGKQLKLLQKLLVLFLRKEISITPQLYNRLKRSKKLAFIEQKFSSVRKDADLRRNLLQLAPLIQLFVKLILKK